MYYLHLVKSTLDERKTLTKVSTRTTSHNHSPKQVQASDTKEQENQQTRQKASCIARGENQFPAVCKTRLQWFALNMPPNLKDPKHTNPEEVQLNLHFVFLCTELNAKGNEHI